MITIRQLIYLLLVITTFFARCSGKNRAKTDLENLLPGFIKDSIYLSSANPFTKDKAELGRYLFYDRRLSINNTKACASCHAQEFSFTDSYSRSIGALGDLHQRNAKPLINIIFEKFLTAADSAIHFPESQINNPMFNEHPVELGVKGNENEILERIKTDKYYQQQFKRAFPSERNPESIKNIQYAISTFVKTILSFNSPYDNVVFRKDSAALSKQEINGMNLFFSANLKCSSCHSGINFNTPLLKTVNGETDFYFNTGLYNLDGKGSYPAYDQGLIALTKNPADMGKYKVPTLRNLAFTAPYFHDGSAATLDEVITVYENGGRNIPEGQIKGDGRNNLFKHPLVSGFKLNSQERKDLVAFLLSLSDSSVLKNQAYANPFSDDETKKNNP
jgi:cytochrome c peroxidase